MSRPLVSQSTVPARPPTDGRAPDFVIIGAAKSGTTTLWQYLCRHPQIGVSREKEPEFFADKFKLGWSWYRDLFADVGPDQRCGDASTMYTWWQDYPLAARRIGEFLPDARLIYIMRHPVDRLYSDYGEQIRTQRALGTLGPELDTFESFLEHFPHLVTASEYFTIIQEYRNYFARDALLLLLLDDLRADPTGVLRRVCWHIGIDHKLDLVANDQVHANDADTYRHWQLRVGLTRSLRAIPGVEWLGGLVPRTWRERAYRALERSSRAARIRAELAPAPMLAETRRRLIDRFREPTQQLAEYLGRDLSHWMK